MICMATEKATSNFKLQVTLSMRKFDSTDFGNFYVTDKIIIKEELNHFIDIPNSSEEMVEKTKFQPGSMLGAFIMLKKGQPRNNNM